MKGLLFILLCITSCVWANPPLLSWYDLMDYDSDSGVSAQSLKKKMSTRVRVVGFIVPLIDNTNFDTVKEFYLVPDPMMCIHVPPPPPNQMIHVKMKNPVPLDIDFEGVWIHGKIVTKPGPIAYGDPGFYIEGSSAEACDDYPFDEFLDPLSVLEGGI